MRLSIKNTVQRKAIAYLIIINLVGSFLAPLVANAAASETRVLLCTSQGYQWVTLATEQELQPTMDSLWGEHCIYCLSSDDDIEQAVFAYSYLELVPVEYLFLINNDPAIANHHLCVTRLPRAPPIFI